MRSASSPATPRPVRIMSIAWLWPMSRGRRTVPRSISGTPQRRQKTPKTASVAATRRSHQSASSRPPATAYPSTAAMTGFPSSMRDGPMGPSPSSLMRLSAVVHTAAPRRSWPEATAFRSAPAQNVPPAPVRTATASASSASKRRNASTSAPAVGSSTALRTSGRLMVTTATSPSVSNRTVLMRVSLWQASPPSSIRGPALTRDRDVRALLRPRPRALPADPGPALPLPLAEARRGARPSEARAARVERLRLHHGRRRHGKDDAAARLPGRPRPRDGQRLHLQPARVGLRAAEDDQRRPRPLHRYAQPKAAGRFAQRAPPPSARGAAALPQPPRPREP